MEKGHEGACSDSLALELPFGSVGDGQIIFRDVQDVFKGISHTSDVSRSGVGNPASIADGPQSLNQGFLGVDFQINPALGWSPEVTKVLKSCAHRYIVAWLAEYTYAIDDIGSIPDDNVS